jgi:signal transduction histidine kinase
MHNLVFLLPISKELVRISYAYRTSILLSSVAITLGFAAILLSSKEARQLAGSWVNYVGLAFLAYSFQYVFRLIGWLIRDTEGELFRSLQVGCNFFANFGSGANNLFFLAAALILLNRRTSFLRPRIFITIVSITAALTTAANFYFVEKESPWWAAGTRLPDAVFSAFCLGLFGYATMRNFLTHQRKYWATLVLFIGGIYAIIQLIYAANPVRADWQKPELEAVLYKAIYSPKPSGPVEYLDSSVFAMALPLKMLLFVPAFYLFFTLVIAAHDFRKILRAVRDSKRSYLSSDGIVQAIGESVAADSVEVFIRMPGTDPWSAWCIPWPPSQASQYVVLDHEANPDPQLLKVLRGEAQIPVSHSGEWQQIHTSLPPHSEKPLVMLPVRFHGAVVGCLKATFGHKRRFNYAALQQLNGMADLLAPAVQDYRALASLDQLSYRFARLQVRKSETEFDETTGEMGRILHNVLAPLAVGLLLEAGFRANHVLHGEGEFLRLLEGQIVRYEVEDLTTQIMRTDTGEVKIYKNQLLVTPRDDISQEYPMGNLVLILPSLQDKINHPTLGDYGLHRRAIATHTADAFLDLVRDHLGYELNALSIKLNSESLTQDAWLKSIQEMAENVGLLWVGATRKGSEKIEGDGLAVKLIPGLDEEARRVLEATPISCVVHDDEITQTHHVMRIELSKSEYQLWFGIARDGFGFELDFPSPWRGFLEDFRDLVDSALFSMFEAQRSKERVARMAEQRGVMNIALTTGHFMHTLANKVDEQLFPAESLLQAALRKDIMLDDVQMTQVEAILNGAKVMKDLMSIFKDVKSTNLQRPCSLREVVTQALGFYEYIMSQSGIKFTNKVGGDASIDVPFNVALFAISNLIGNSKEAIMERRKDMGAGYTGEITIEAKSTRENVICYVQDNGSGIPDHIKGKLFTLGATSKSYHNGWGLYFTRSSLGENGSEIDLVESSPGYTRFKIKFPKGKGS